MATTTNYGWTTPDDTALVKDGASAIRTLGSSIDTTTKALNPSTTLGDIEYRSSTANTNTRLGIGSTGNVLTVTGGVPVWAAPASGGGMTLLSTTTLANNTTTVSSISQSYNDLMIIVNNVRVSTGAQFTFDLNSNAGGINMTLFQQGSSPSSLSDLRTPSNLPTTAQTSDSVYYILIKNYTSTTTGKIIDFIANTNGTSPSNISARGILGSLPAIDEIAFDLTGAATFTTGTALIYGVK